MLHRQLSYICASTCLLIASLLLAPEARAGYWVGAKAPELTMDGMVRGPANPDDVKLAKLPGKTVVLAFWSINCPSCPKVMPHLNGLVEELSDEPFQVISVVNYPPEDVQDFLENQHQLDERIWVGVDGMDQSITYDYLIMGVPMTVIINDKGTVAAVTHPLNVTAEAVRDVMAGKAPVVEMPPAAEGLLDKELPTQLPIYEVLLRASAQDGYSRFSRVGGLRFFSTPLRDMLFQAYGVPPSLIYSDSLLLSAKYDGKIIPPPHRVQDAREMLKTMLTNSFPLTAEKEQRPVEVIAMQMPNGPGPELRPAADEGDWIFELTDRYVRAKKTPMNYFAYRLSEEFGIHVIPETDEDEIYDFTVSWVSMDDEDPRGFKARMLEKLGLDMKRETRVMEVLQVERSDLPAQ